MKESSLLSIDIDCHLFFNSSLFMQWAAKPKNATTSSQKTHAVLLPLWGWGGPQLHWLNPACTWQSITLLGTASHQASAQKGFLPGRNRGRKCNFSLWQWLNIDLPKLCLGSLDPKHAQRSCQMHGSYFLQNKIDMLFKNYYYTIYPQQMHRKQN